MNINSIENANRIESVRDMISKMLANEFLNTPEVAFELRAYTLESVIPTLAIAIEKLILEVEGKEIDQDGQLLLKKESESKDESKYPKPDFDPLNWLGIVFPSIAFTLLGQFLYRNNPKHASLAKSAPYIKGLGDVSKQIRHQMFLIEEAKRQAQLAEEARIKRLKEEEEELLKIQIQQRRAYFKLILTGIFDETVKKLWREDNSYIYKDEIIDAFTVISKIDVVENDPRLLLRARKIVKALTLPVSDAKYTDKSAIYDDCIDGQPSYKDPSLLVKFDSFDFMKEMYKLMMGWTMDDLNVFKKYFDETIDTKSKDIWIEYESICKFPRLNGIKTSSSVEDLMTKILEISSIFNCNNLNAKAIGAAFESVELDATLDGYERLDTAFKAASRILVAHYGIKPYVEWMQYISKVISAQPKDVDGSEDELPLGEDSTREGRLNKLFSFFPNDVLSEEQFVDLVNQILEHSRPFLNLKIQKGIVEWKKETEIQSFDVGKQDHIHRLLDIFQDVFDQDFSDFISELLKIHEYHSLNSNNTVTSSEVIENQGFSRALEQIKSLKSRGDLNVVAACNLALCSLCQALESVHSSHTITGTLGLLENSATKLENGHSLNEEFLRYVAASKELEFDFLGSCANEDSPDLEILKSKELAIQDSKLEPRYQNDVRFQVSAGAPSKILAFYGLALTSKNNKSIGSAAFKLQGESDLLGSADIEFLQNGLYLLVDVLSSIDSKSQYISMIASAKKFTAFQDMGEMEYYFKDDETNQIYFIQPVLDVVLPGEGTQIRATVAASPFFLPLTHTFHAIDSSLPNYENILECFKSSKGYEEKTESHLLKFEPILNSDGKVIGLVKFTGEVESESLDRNISLISKVLDKATKFIDSCIFGENLFTKEELEIESIDELARRDSLFDKLILLEARDVLSNLTSQSISELKSYKRPPESVYRIVKAVLYLFGKKPKEVRSWGDLIKFINQELLADMVKYDPTSMQKKIRFMRVKRALKCTFIKDTAALTTTTIALDVKDSDHRATSPSTFMYEWLSVSLILRETAVEIRKRRNDIFSKEHGIADSTDELDAEENDDDEEIVLDS